MEENNLKQKFYDKFAWYGKSAQIKYGIPASVILAQMYQISGGDTTNLNLDMDKQFEEQSKLMMDEKYSECKSLGATDYKGWAKGLEAAGYATAKGYSKKLIDDIKSYQLDRFDLQAEEKAANIGVVSGCMRDATEKPKEIEDLERFSFYYACGRDAIDIQLNFGIPASETLLKAAENKFGKVDPNEKEKFNMKYIEDIATEEARRQGLKTDIHHVEDFRKSMLSAAGNGTVNQFIENPLYKLIFELLGALWKENIGPQNGQSREDWQKQVNKQIKKNLSISTIPEEAYTVDRTNIEHDTDKKQGIDKDKIECALDKAMSNFDLAMNNLQQKQQDRGLHV